MDFTAVVHDLRGPLHVMLGHMKLLAVEPLSDTGRQRLGVVAAQVRRMMRLLDGCSELQDRVQLFAPVDVGALIGTVVSEIDTPALRRAIEIHSSLFGALPPVLGDGDLLHRVLVNVLLNAVDALGSSGRVEIDAFAKPSATPSVRVLHIDISDNGAGIPPELLTRVFEPGFSTNVSGRRRGYGLAICREIVDLHGGDIQLSSEPGRGTRVRVSLPVTSSISDAADPPVDEALPHP
jgi:signal transduction histidine kinase